MAAASKSVYLSPSAAVIGIVCLLLMLMAGLLLTSQGLFWLRTGHWPGLATRSLWTALGGAEPSIGWLGMQPITAWILDQPLSLVLFVVAVAGLFVVRRAIQR
jgi:hypothetical protein